MRAQRVCASNPSRDWPPVFQRSSLIGWNRSFKEKRVSEDKKFGGGIECHGYDGFIEVMIRTNFDQGLWFGDIFSAFGLGWYQRSIVGSCTCQMVLLQRSALRGTASPRRIGLVGVRCVESSKNRPSRVNSFESALCSRNYAETSHFCTCMLSKRSFCLGSRNGRNGPITYLSLNTTPNWNLPNESHLKIRGNFYGMVTQSLESRLYPMLKKVCYPTVY